MNVSNLVLCSSILTLLLNQLMRTIYLNLNEDYFILFTLITILALMIIIITAIMIKKSGLNMQYL